MDSEYVQICITIDEMNYLIKKIKEIITIESNFKEVEHLFNLMNTILKKSYPPLEYRPLLMEFALFIKSFVDENSDGSEVDYNVLTDFEKEIIMKFIEKKRSENDFFQGKIY